MPKTSIFLHKSTMDYADLVATVVDTSRSEIISDCIRYIKENVDEEKIWDDYDDKLEAYERLLRETREESESESEEDEDEEEDEEEED